MASCSPVSPCIRVSHRRGDLAPRPRWDLLVGWTVHRSAVISRDGRFRYSLRRVWDATKPTVLFIGLNPSVADHRIDDQTIRRCITFARSWGFGQLAMANLFALRTPSPRELRRASDPVGPRNDRWLRRLVAEAEEVVMAWGDHGAYLARDRVVLAMLQRPRCLGLSKLGHPRHPLYLRSTTVLCDLDHGVDKAAHCSHPSASGYRICPRGDDGEDTRRCTLRQRNRCSVPRPDLLTVPGPSTNRVP